MEHLEFGTRVYGLVDRGTFGIRIVIGVIIGVEFTKDEPRYCLDHMGNKVWTSKVTEDREALLDMMELPKLHTAKSYMNYPTKQTK